MNWDFEERQRRMRNYSIMLRLALACVAIAVLTTLAGGVHALVAGDPIWLVYGLLFLVWSVGSAYLTIDSTVRVIESDTKDSGSRSR